MEFSDQFRIVDTINFSRCLLKNLSYSEGFCHVGADVISFAAVLCQEVLDHLGVLECVDLRIPAAIRDEDSFCSIWTTYGFGKLSALVWTRCSYDGLWIVVLLLKGLYVS